MCSDGGRTVGVRRVVGLKITSHVDIGVASMDGVWRGGYVDSAFLSRSSNPAASALIFLLSKSREWLFLVDR